MSKKIKAHSKSKNFQFYLNNPLGKPDILENYFELQDSYKSAKLIGFKNFIQTHLYEPIEKKQQDCYTFSFSIPKPKINLNKTTFKDLKLFAKFFFKKSLQLVLTCFTLFCIFFTGSFIKIFAEDQPFFNKSWQKNLTNKKEELEKECKKIKFSWNPKDENLQSTLEILQKNPIYFEATESLLQSILLKPQNSNQEAKQENLENNYKYQNLSLDVFCYGKTEKSHQDFLQNFIGNFDTKSERYFLCHFLEKTIQNNNLWQLVNPKNQSLNICFKNILLNTEQTDSSEIIFLSLDSRSKISKQNVYKTLIKAEYPKNNLNLNFFLSFRDQDGVAYGIVYKIQMLELLYRDYNFQINLQES